LRVKHEIELAGLRKQAAELEAKVAQILKELEEYKDVEDLDAETLADLTTQQRLITVELAGVEARIEACEKILARLRDMTAPGSRIEQVETVKVTAEIELVGLMARKDAIGAIVDRARAKRDLANKLADNQGVHWNVNRQIGDQEQFVAACEQLRKEAMPFEIKGKITIYPIQWEPVKRQ
jgi:hypothetical protein